MFDWKGYPIYERIAALSILTVIVYIISLLMPNANVPIIDIYNINITTERAFQYLSLISLSMFIAWYAKNKKSLSKMKEDWWDDWFKKD